MRRFQRHLAARFRCYSLAVLTDSDIATLQAEGGGSFVFLPSVRGFAENRWQFQSSTRIEFCATNSGSGDQVWFPRSSVSRVIVEPGGITVALNREYEYKGGLWPVRSPQS